MQTTNADRALALFRRGLYRVLGQRQGTLFEVVEAALLAPPRSTLVQLSEAA